MKIVDLGTRIGTSIDLFLNRGADFFPASRKVIRAADFSQCLGVDIDESCRVDLESRGASFDCLDLSQPDALRKLPKADFYIASKVLHHLGSKEVIDDLVGAMLPKVRRGIWFRLLSFEPDNQTGEGVLREQGLRFGWTEKYTPYLCRDVLSCLSSKDIHAELKPARRIRHTKDERVVPIDADPDKDEYEEVMGHKPQVKLVTPLVVEWDLFIRKK